MPRWQCLPSREQRSPRPASSATSLEPPLVDSGMLLPQPPGGDVVRAVVCLAVAGDGDENPLSLEADEPSADRGGDSRSPQPVVEGRNLTEALTSFETVDRGARLSRRRTC